MTAYLLHVLFGITLLLSAALLGALLLRKKSASVRHSVLISALFGVLLVPLLVPMLPHWSLGVVEMATDEQSRNRQIAESSQRDEMSITPGDSRGTATPTTFFSPDGALQNQDSVAPLGLSDREVPSPRLTPGVIEIASLQDASQIGALVFWLIGTTLLLLRFTLSLLAARRIIANTMPMDKPMLAAILRRLNITQSVSLRQSEVGIVPFTFGIRKPVIVLPESSAQWSEEERRAVLTHELSHVARRDVCWQVLAELCCAVYWFHPLIWLTAWQLRVEREIACDDLVVLAGEEPPKYAAILLRLAGGLKGLPTRKHVLGCMVAMARHHEVKQRIRSILNPQLLRKPLGRWGLLCLLFVAAVGIAAATMLSPTTAKEPGTEGKHSPPVEGWHFAQQNDGVVIPLNGGAGVVPPVTTPPLRGTPPKEGNYPTARSTAPSPAPLNPKMTTITGKALLPDGSPAVGMHLLVSGRSKTDPNVGGASNSFTKAGGNFSIDALVPAESMLSIFDPKGKWAAPSLSLSLDDADEYGEEIVFQLEEGIRITGKIVDDTTGKPMPNMELAVAFYENETDGRNRTHFKITSDEKGEYAFAALATEDVYVSVGTVAIHRITERLPGQEHRAKLLQKVAFNGQQAVNLADFRIPAPFVGKVLRADGSPAANALVQVTSLGMPAYDFVHTDKDGMFRLAERPQNVFCTIWVHSNSMFSMFQSNSGEVFADWFDDDLPKTGEKVFRLHKACSIKGRLIDSATKKPIANQLVLLERSNVANPKQKDAMPLWAKTDSRGNFNFSNFIAFDVRHELFIVPGKKEFHGSLPPDVPRVVLAAANPDTPGKTVNLGDIAVPDDEKMKKLAIAVMPDAPLVTISGSVFMPDGSPAAKCHVNVSSAAFTFSKSFSHDDGTVSILKDSVATGTRGTSGGTKPDGTFSFDNVALPGANVVITVNSWDTNESKRFVSQPITFVARENMEPLMIVLEEGIPVRGKIMYDNGTPAAGRGVFLKQSVKPILGSDIPDMKRLFETSQHCAANESGEFERYFPPGTYTIDEKHVQETFTIAKSDKEKRLDLKMPTPIFVEVEMPDGTPAKNIWYFLTGAGSSTSREKSSLVFDPVSKNSDLYLTAQNDWTDRNGDYGIIATLTPAMRGTTQKLTLKPVGKVAVTLVDANGTPVVGERVSLSIVTRTEGGGTSSMSPGWVETDENGKAVLRVPAGKVSISVSLPGSFAEPLLGGGRAIRNEIEREIDLSPGETLNLGRVMLQSPRL